MKWFFLRYVVRCVVVLCAFGSALSFAASVDVAVNTKEAQVGFLVDNISGSEASFGGYFIHGKDRDQAFWLSFRTPPNSVSDTPWLFSAAIDAYASHSNGLGSIAAYGFAIGGSVGYRFLTGIPTNVTIEVHYSPPVFSLGDAESYYLAEGRFEALFTPSVIVYLGYKNQRADFNENQERLRGKNYYNITDSLFLGLKIRF